MNWNNRLSDDVGERAIEHCERLKVDIWRRDNGRICASFELHGSIGDQDIFEDDDDEAGDLKEAREPTDISLVFELLKRFQQKSD